MRRRRITEDDIENAKTQNGGWTKRQFEEWGIEWPPKKGWKHRLIHGAYTMRPRDKGLFATEEDNDL